MENNYVIQTHHLTRNFKKVRAVDGLTFAIQTGELFGLVGPDGAGKTTTLRLLAGLLDVSEGNADMLGFDLKEKSESIKPHVGYMAQQFSLYSELSVMENLQFFSELFDVKAQELAERAERLLNFAGLIEFTNRRAGNLSGGMQKKLALACTLIHEPEILLLDEPTTGVDPISRREFWNILTDLHLQGTTILVSTPYMDEADRCSRVGLMYAGKLVECDSPKAIRDKLEGEIIEIRPQRPEDWQKILSVVTSLNGVSEAQTYGESVHLLVDSGERRMTQVRHALEAENIPYRSIRIAPARMEEAFISLMRKMEA
jgi:ABC-2 type transport system ATP-binding protein